MNSLDAVAIAAGVRRGEMSAVATVSSALDRIARRDRAVNAFTAVFAERALVRAEAVDRAAAAGADLPLAGVPFGVKNLFDVEGTATVAGSAIRRDAPPAPRDAFAIRRLEAAGAILVGTLNMDEFASGFTTENTHYGATRNPHDTGRMAGGSSGGSAAAVAAGMVPVTLGSDSNGSIRVPSAACGVWGLKPTYGRLSRAGTAVFTESFDHVGPLAATLGGLAATYDALQGRDDDDPVQADRSPEPVGMPAGRPLAVALAAGPHFERVDAEGASLARAASEALGGRQRVAVPLVEAGWAAAVVITLTEGSAVHLDELRTRAAEFDPMTRARFLAGALVPVPVYLEAQRARRAFYEAARSALATVDVLVTPAVPFAAPPIGCNAVDVAGEVMDPRGAFGLFTQPFSCIGLPAMAVPMRGTGLPRAVQLVANPFREDLLFAAAERLIEAGLAGAALKEDWIEGE